MSTRPGPPLDFGARALTAPGTAAIAAMRVYGADAAHFLQAHVAARGAQGAGTGVGAVLPSAGRQRWLSWRQAGETIDDVIVVALPIAAGGGYEVHGHGGPVGMRLWQAAVEGAGGQWAAGAGAAPGAVADGSLSDGESWRADFARVWAQVETATQAAVVGASQALIVERLRQQPAVAAWPTAWREELLCGAPARVDGLLRRQRLLLAGPVNAGKSTLFNAWLAEKRALTSDRPGTTRDLVAGRIELAGLAVEILDSAGLRAVEAVAADRGGSLEQRGMALTQATQGQVDLTLWLSPAGEPTAPPAGWGKVLAAVSKADLVPAMATGTGGEPAVSARTGAGMDALAAAVAERLWPTAERSAAMQPGVCSRAQWNTLAEVGA